MFNAFFSRHDKRTHNDFRRFVQAEYGRVIHSMVKSGISYDQAIDNVTRGLAK